MALSQTFHNTNGVTEEWDLSLSGGYLSRDHVKAYFYPTGNLEDARQTKTFTWLNDTRIRITPALASDGMLLIQRETPRNDLLVQFTNTADFNKDNLMTLGRQAIFVAAELIDLYEDPELIGAIADAKQAAQEAVAAAATTGSNVVAAEAAATAAGAAQASTELAADAALSAASDASTSADNAATLAGQASSYATSANANRIAAQEARDAVVNAPVVPLTGTNIDVQAGAAFTKTISANTTLTVSNVPAAPKLSVVILELTFTAGFTITWWSGVKWSFGLAPVFGTGGKSSLMFVTTDGGATWTGSVIAKEVA
jgi:hypothetical protein